jgi:biopolymer transport protein ExbB/TolQ
MTLAVILDVVVVVMLVAAIVVAIVLNRRLAAFRAAKAEFEQVIERFNTAAARAEAGVNALKMTGETTGGALQKAVARAQALRDELSFLTERAEPMVDRLTNAHRAASAQAAAAPVMAAAPVAPAPSAPPSMPIPSAEAELLKTLSSLR